MKHMKHIVLALLLSMTFHAQVFAAGSGNIDGGGSGLGQGTSQNFWSVGNDGVRITVVDAETGSPASSSIDFTNKTFNQAMIHFQKVSKIGYRSGTGMAVNTGGIVYKTPAIPLPTIMTSRSRPANIQTIRSYFCSEYAAQMMADAVGMTFEELTSGSYKLVIEPICFFTFNGNFYAMTATEAAIYNQLSGGALVSRLPNVLFKNLPLAIFLQTPDLGYPAWSGSTNTQVSDAQIIAALGIGIVSYEGQEAPPEVEAPDYTYRVDTDVITSVTVTANREINPDSPASVTFRIDGHTYRVGDIVIPDGGSQVVWVKWHTPSTPQTLTIQVSCSRGQTAETSFQAKIESLDDNPPPDPLATDVNPGFRSPSLPVNTQNTSAAWSVWYAYWVPDWDWCDHGDDGGHWVDNGWWEFDTDEYHASVTGSMTLMPDDIVPTASGKNMRSGYGVKETVTSRLTTNAPSDHYAVIQNAVSYFPEFKYENYWRLLDRTGNLTATFQFKENEYSTYNRRVHFSPVWYPDSTYTVYTYVLDAWTPVGMLSMNLNDNVQIQGSMFDDWYSRRE